MKQPIVGFHKDEEDDWVADLACGHTQHVRHNPPWQLRRKADRSILVMNWSVKFVTEKGKLKGNKTQYWFTFQLLLNPHGAGILNQAFSVSSTR